ALGGVAYFHYRGRQHAAALVDVLRHARDLLRLVADALEVGDRLDDRDDQPQVVGCRLALDDHLAAIAVERDFHGVHAVVGGDDVIERGAVARVEALERAPDLRLDQPAHFQHARAGRLDVGIKLLRQMFGRGHCGYDVMSYDRAWRDVCGPARNGNHPVIRLPEAKATHR